MPDTLTCKQCRARVDPLAVFPGGICLQCHAEAFDRKYAAGNLPRPDFVGALNIRSTKRR